MGVKLLGKIKIYEIAKKLGLTSKEVLDMAQKLNIDAKSHMSGLEEEQAKLIEKNLTNKGENKQSAKNAPKKEEKAPVIIRREVIITDEQNKKIEPKNNERNNNIGFIERKQNKDYNIVYRNKPNKPKTVDELFGLKKEVNDKITEKPKEEKEIKLEVPTIQGENNKNMQKEEQKELKKTDNTRIETKSNRATFNNNNYSNNKPNNYNNRNKQQKLNNNFNGNRQNNRNNNSNYNNVNNN